MFDWVLNMSPWLLLNFFFIFDLGLAKFKSAPIHTWSSVGGTLWNYLWKLLKESYPACWRPLAKFKSAPIHTWSSVGGALWNYLWKLLKESYPACWRPLLCSSIYFGPLFILFILIYFICCCKNSKIVY